MNMIKHILNIYKKIDFIYLLDSYRIYITYVLYVHIVYS